MRPSPKWETTATSPASSIRPGNQARTRRIPLFFGVSSGRAVVLFFSPGFTKFMSFSRVPPGPGRPNGFTLIEALVALTILGVALLLGMQLLIQTPRIIRRIDAERQAFRALEATLEGVRGGSVSLVDQTLKCFHRRRHPGLPTPMTHPEASSV